MIAFHLSLISLRTNFHTEIDLAGMVYASPIVGYFIDRRMPEGYWFFLLIINFEKQTKFI